MNINVFIYIPADGQTNTRTDKFEIQLTLDKARKTKLKKQQDFKENKNILNLHLRWKINIYNYIQYLKDIKLHLSR